MKTTLVIPDPVMKRVKVEAARRGTTLSDLVESALRAYLDAAPTATTVLPPLPTFDGGGPLVNIADREALYLVMEAPRDRALYGRTRPARRRQSGKGAR